MQLTFSGAYIEKVRKKYLTYFSTLYLFPVENQLSLIIKKTGHG